MAELKTKPTKASVEAFLKRIADDGRREDCVTLVKIMKQATRAEPKMWGPGIVGFGIYRYKYASGREGEWFLTGFAPRKRDLTLYIMTGFEHYEALLAKLGKHKSSKSCLYIKRLADVDLRILKELVTASVRYLKKTQNQ
jgi:hypothetical protein